MKNIKIILVYVILFLSLTGCKTEELYLKKLDVIPADKYYSTDILPDSAKIIYGTWKALQTSGGIAGTSYKPDFDYLLLKPNAVFGIVRKDSLIAYGKLTLLIDKSLHLNNSVLCKFDFDKTAQIELMADNEKYISIVNNDTMNLIAPCCDRYNTQLVRVNSDWYNSVNPGTLKGKITIGPLCPVETIPPQPGCSPTAETYKAWQTAIWNSNKTRKIVDIIPNLDGTFQINLSTGEYIIDFVNQNNNKSGGSGLPLKFSITRSKTTQLLINIDTGIR